MRVGNKSFASQFLRHVENIVYLDHTVMWVQSLKSWKVWQDVTAPSNVTLARPEFKFAGCRAIHFIIFRNMIYAVMWNFNFLRRKQTIQQEKEVKFFQVWFL
mgnify:CR=1 FL=1